MGYLRHEVLGQFHSIFVSQDESDSEQYEQFWQKLRSGQYQAGEFERYGKHGERKWIQGTYNPVKGESGEVEKIVKYATDITAEKQLLAAFAERQRLESLGGLAEGVAHEIGSPLQIALSCLEYMNQAHRRVQISRKAKRRLQVTNVVGREHSDGHRDAVCVVEAESLDIEGMLSAGEDALEAVRSIDKIVWAMKSATGDNSANTCDVKLKEVINDALTLTRSKWKEVSSPKVEVSSDAQYVCASRSHLFRVVSQMICASAESLKQVGTSSPDEGIIEVHTRQLEDNTIEIMVADNGLSADDRSRGSATYESVAEVDTDSEQLAVLDEIALTSLGAEWTINDNPTGGAIAILAIPNEAG